MNETPETPPTPQVGMAQAVGDLSEQARRLVRQELGVAEREIRDKVTEIAPALALGAAAGGLGLLAAASAYRLSLRFVEKRLPPAAAAFAATLGYGGAAAGAAVLAARRIRRMPPLFPVGTARQASEAVAEVTDKADASARASGRAGDLRERRSLTRCLSGGVLQVGCPLHVHGAPG